ncbi:MAG TPA: hypothetical protein VK469_18500 [Candidatus Kapabacteria bacterium]|nr:hypothetical protein [Candidatus Kapabacteria bacterium]
MNKADDKNKKKWQEIAFEDIVVTSAVTIGLLGGLIMSLYKEIPSIITGIFLGMGISSLIYRFLGGISPGNSFTVKGIKLTGTVAVWIAAALIISTNIDKSETAYIGNKHLILKILNNNDHFMRGIQLWVADELIPPQKEAQSTYAIPLKKFIDEDDKILIDQISEKGEAQKSMKMEYDPKIPRITIYIENR